MIQGYAGLKTAYVGTYELFLLYHGCGKPKTHSLRCDTLSLFRKHIVIYEEMTIFNDYKNQQFILPLLSFRDFQSVNQIIE